MMRPEDACGEPRHARSDGYPFDLGRFGRQTSTPSTEAQGWFDRGLIWSYAFNHEEAIRCFERSIAADERFAFAHWGVAYAAGPNYNKQWDAFDETDLRDSLRRAHEATQRALELSEAASEVERDLIGALTARYPGPEPTDDLTASTAAYAEAMRAVYARHPDDLDIAALSADALMNVTPWSLWDLATGEPADGAHTLEAKRVLESALPRPGGMTHPGLLHFYIHLMEMSPAPEAALKAADALRGLVPDGGHLLHMPTHIDVLLGDYERVIADNERAIAADERYAGHAGSVNFYSLYRAHDHHFRIYGAMFAGRRATALSAANALAEMRRRDLRTKRPDVAVPQIVEQDDDDVRRALRSTALARPGPGGFARGTTNVPGKALITPGMGRDQIVRHPSGTTTRPGPGSGYPRGTA
jgi:tetratricopeptide (TPR) repeat protein